MTRPVITTEETTVSTDNELTAQISDAHHEGFGAGMASAQDGIEQRIAAAEVRGYERAVANLRELPGFDAWVAAFHARLAAEGRFSGPERIINSHNWADYLDAMKETS